MSIKTSAFFAALVLSAGTAFAGSIDVPSQVVNFQDLNLDSQAGVTALYHRIVSAAAQVCGGDRFTALSVKHVYQECARQSESRAVAQINSPALSAFYQAKAGRALAVVASN